MFLKGDHRRCVIPKESTLFYFSEGASTIGHEEDATADREENVAGEMSANPIGELQVR